MTGQLPDGIVIINCRDTIVDIILRLEFACGDGGTSIPKVVNFHRGTPLAVEVAGGPQLNIIITRAIGFIICIQIPIRKKAGIAVGRFDGHGRAVAIGSVIAVAMVFIDRPAELDVVILYGYIYNAPHVCRQRIAICFFHQGQVQPAIFPVCIVINPIVSY